MTSWWSLFNVFVPWWHHIYFPRSWSFRMNRDWIIFSEVQLTLTLHVLSFLAAQGALTAITTHSTHFFRSHGSSITAVYKGILARQALAQHISWLHCGINGDMTWLLAERTSWQNMPISYLYVATKPENFVLHVDRNPRSRTFSQYRKVSSIESSTSKIVDTEKLWFFVFFRRKSRILRPKTHIFGS